MTNKVRQALSKGIYLFSSDAPKKPKIKPTVSILDIIINAFISQHKAEQMRFKPILIKLWLNKLNLKK